MFNILEDTDEDPNNPGVNAKQALDDAFYAPQGGHTNPDSPTN